MEPVTFTDIHCHILPGVDDGARSMDESVRMLRLMYDEGIREAVATPHYHRGHAEADAAVLKKIFKELCECAAEDDKAGAVKLHLGCELYYYPSAPDWLDEGRVLPMAGSRYVLLEFGYRMDKRVINEGVSNVVRAGYIPVIAHVERYDGLGFKTGNIRDLIEQGALIQINSEAVGFGIGGVKSFTSRLLKSRMVHFVATDAHDTKGRAPSIRKAARYIAKHYGEDYCKEIFCDNPREMILSQQGV